MCKLAPLADMFWIERGGCRSTKKNANHFRREHLLSYAIHVGLGKITLYRPMYMYVSWLTSFRIKRNAMLVIMYVGISLGRRILSAKDLI